MKDPLIRKQIYLVSKFYSSLDEVVQIRGLREVLNNVSAEMGVLCCDLALPVL